MVSRRRLRSWALVVLAPFLTGNALPRASVYAHHHAGGDHAHVHPWGEDAVVDDHGDDRGHAHAGTHDDGSPGLEDPDDGHARHVHWQAPYQQTARSEPPHLLCAAIVLRFAAESHLAAGLEPTPPAIARGPPRSAA